MQSGKRGLETGMNNNSMKCNKICGRLCVELKGHLASPLSISSGEQEETDADVILDERGFPMIPGSSLAGVLLDYSREFESEKELSRLFGMQEERKHGTQSDRQSRVFCYDTILENANAGIRDGVKLGENKTPEQHSKYEMQIVERDADFRMRIEIIQRQECLAEGCTIEEAWSLDMLRIRRWFQGFQTGELRIGGKANRGYGKLDIESARIKKFHMEDAKEYRKWLDWHWDDTDAFAEAESVELINAVDEHARTEHVLEVPLHIPYTLLVRSYSTAFTKKDSLPDYGQLTVNGEGEQAVIPGTSLAGAFRSQIAKSVNRIAHLNSWEAAQKKLEPFFGTWVTNQNHEEDLLPSKIIFEEMKIDGGHGLTMTRNAIDRFTGGTVEGALFEETPWAGGSALLRIRWKKENRDHDAICGLLLWAVMDLQSGILPIGGETAIGRGIFCGADGKMPDIQLDGNTLDEKKKEEYMRAAAMWCKGEKNGTAER